jgi:hypothetical protein
MPTEVVGLLTKIGVGITNNENAAVAAQIQLDGVESDLRVRVNRIITGVGTGSLMPRRALTSHVWVEGGLRGDVQPNSFGYILHALGAPPTTSGTGPYTHTFNYGAASQSRWLSVVHAYNDISRQEVFGGLAATRLRLGFDAERDEVLQFDMDLIGTYAAVFNNEGTVIPAGVGVDSADPFVQALATVETPIGTAIAQCIAADLEITTERAIRWTARGSVFPRGHQPVTGMRVRGTIRLTFENDNFLKAFLNQAGASTYPLQHKNDPTAPTTSLKLKWAPATDKQLEISIPKIVWTEISEPVRRNAVVEQELSFEALLDSSLGRGLQIILTNSTSAYNPGTQIGGS